MSTPSLEVGYAPGPPPGFWTVLYGIVDTPSSGTAGEPIRVAGEGEFFWGKRRGRAGRPDPGVDAEAQRISRHRNARQG